MAKQAKQTANVQNTGGHHALVNLTRSKPRRVIQVVANPTTSTSTGWPVGFWAAELTHPYYELTEAGYEVTIASPDGGKVAFDNLSDPRDPSKWSAEDLISMGFINTPDLMQLLDATPKLASLNFDEYDALMVCGGQSPMFTFRDNADLHAAIRTFYEAEKPVALFCHGVAALVDATLSDGSYLAAGKTVTGFANVEEDYSDTAAGTKIMPWRLEDALRERGANYIQGGLFKAFAVRDGRLITGQQQYSGRKVAQMVIEALGQ
jgi:putative intracellular protease/amidase